MSSVNGFVWINIDAMGKEKEEDGVGDGANAWNDHESESLTGLFKYDLSRIVRSGDIQFR